MSKLGKINRGRKWYNLKEGRNLDGSFIKSLTDSNSIREDIAAYEATLPKTETKKTETKSTGKK